MVQYHQALAQQDGQRALGLLSRRTREALAAQAKQASQATGGALPEDPAKMIIQGDPARYDPEGKGKPRKVEVTLLSQEGDRARARATLDGLSHEVELVKEDGSWRLDLPAR